MRLIIKAGRDLVFSTTADEKCIIINLYARWPERVDFDQKTNEFHIQATSDSPVIRVRAAGKIAVDSINVEKDQIVASYRRLDLEPVAGGPGL